MKMTNFALGCGLLFDIDGTLADTDHLHMRAFNDVMSPYGIELDDAQYKLKVMGRTNEAIFGEFLPAKSADFQMRVAGEKEAAFRALAGCQIKPAPGLLDLLAWATRNGVPCACVTNAPRLNAELILSGLNLDKRFPVPVLADDLPHGKPHPLPHLTGAARLRGQGGAAPGCRFGLGYGCHRPVLTRSRGDRAKAVFSWRSPGVHDPCATAIVGAADLL